MTTEQEIEKQLNAQTLKWNEKIYDGKPLPADFIKIFKRAIFTIPPASHQYNMNKVKKMISQRADEVTMVEVGMMINVIYSTPPEKIYSSIEEAVDTTLIFDGVREEFNRVSAAFEYSMVGLKTRLMNMSGVVKKGGATIKMPSRIITDSFNRK